MQPQLGIWKAGAAPAPAAAAGAAGARTAPAPAPATADADRRALERLLGRLDDVKRRLGERRAEAAALQRRKKNLEIRLAAERERLSAHLAGREPGYGQNGALRGLLELVLEMILATEKADAARQEMHRVEQQYLEILDAYLAHRGPGQRPAARPDSTVAAPAPETQETLQQGEAELPMLIAELQGIEVPARTPTSFSELRGKLQWPVTGEFENRFGERKGNGPLSWEGVSIRSDAGESVHAVSNGQVVFSGWFQHMGMLAILDHGEGYMSLYGHNKTLSRKIGEWVQRGDVIASTGNTGGDRVPGLYFEIRHWGIPVDPSLWCRQSAAERRRPVP